MTVDRRVFFSGMAFILTVFAAALYRTATGNDTNDLYFPICAGRALLHGLDPYSGVCAIAFQDKIFPSNPLTAVLVAVPFAPWGYGGAILLWSLLVAILVYAILGTAEYWRLLLLTSAPFWVSFTHLQWSPLITAIVFLPSLLPLALVKPHLGLPVILTNLSPRRMVACVAFVAIAFAVDTRWLLKWWSQTGSYDGYIPLLILPFGWLLILALRNWRTRPAQFLLLMAIVPQRSFYDGLPLATLAVSPVHLMVWSALTWVGYAGGLLFPRFYPQFVVAFFYLPMLAVQLAAVSQAAPRSDGLSRSPTIA